jgi:DNA-binding response OmpR family regulator
MKILITEDNIDLLKPITEKLKSDNFLCETSNCLSTSLEKIDLYEYDVLVIDINLPDGSGLDLIRRIKDKNPNTGVIIISARDSIDNRIEGLELGADDYIIKPFNILELEARIKSLLRRKYFAGNNMVTIKNISIDTMAREVFVNNTKIDLTKSEYDILLFLFANTNKVISKESLAEHIWGDNMDLIDSFDFIYSHIKNLRKKNISAGAEDPIKVVYGIGYKLENE